MFFLTLRYLFRLTVREMPLRKAVEDAGSVFRDFNVRTVLRRRFGTLRNAEEFWVPSEGRYARNCIFDLKEIRQKCRAFLAAKPEEERKPNMTARQFQGLLKRRNLSPLAETCEEKEFLRRCQLNDNISYKRTLRILKDLDLRH